MRALSTNACAHSWLSRRALLCLRAMALPLEPAPSTLDPPKEAVHSRLPSAVPGATKQTLTPPPFPAVLRAGAVKQAEPAGRRATPTLEERLLQQLQLRTARTPRCERPQADQHVPPVAAPQRRNPLARATTEVRPSGSLLDRQASPHHAGAAPERPAEPGTRVTRTALADWLCPRATGQHMRETRSPWNRSSDTLRLQRLGADRLAKRQKRF